MNNYTNSIPEQEIERQFFVSLDNAGIKYKPFNPVMDGKIHRFATVDGKKGNKDGAYIIHTDGRPNWSIQDHRQHGEMIKCKFDSSLLSDSDRREYHSRLAQAQTPEAKKEQEQRRQAEAQRKQVMLNRVRGEAMRLYESADSSDNVYNHPYLQAKGITPEFKLDNLSLKIKTQGNELLIPLINITTGEFASLQKITADSKDKSKFNKRFYNGLTTTDNVYVFSFNLQTTEELLTSERIFIAEGFATGACVYMSSYNRNIGYPVICAMSCHNIIPVAKYLRELREQNSEVEIIIAADHDEAGLAPAIECLEQGLADSVAMPLEIGKDWNDTFSINNNTGLYGNRKSKADIPELRQHLEELKRMKEGAIKTTNEEPKIKPNPVIEPTYELEAKDSQPQTTKEATPKEKSDGIQNSDKFKQFDSIRHNFDTSRPYKRTEYIAGLFPRRHITVVAGAPGAGKTLILQRLYSDISLGGDIAGISTLDRPQKTIVITAEFPEDGLIERAIDFEFKHNSDYIEIIDTTQFPEICFDLNTHDGMELLEHILQSNPDILILDSLGALYTGKENDNTALAQVFNNLSKLAKQYDTAIIIVHHIRKRLSNEQEKPLTWNDIIGGSAIVRYCAQVYGLEFSRKYEMNVITTLKTWKKARRPIGYKIDEDFYGHPHLEIKPNLKEEVANKIESNFTPPDWKEFLDAYMIGKGENGATLAEIKEFLANRPDCPKDGALKMELTRQVKDTKLIKGGRGTYAINSGKQLALEQVNF